MGTFSWQTGVSGAWDTAAKWTGGTVPNGAGDSVVLGGTGSYSVTLPATDLYAIAGLSVTDAAATLALAGALDVTALNNAGTIALNGAAGALVAGGVVGNTGLITVAGGSGFWLAAGSSFGNAGSIALDRGGILGIETTIGIAALGNVSNAGGLIDIYGTGTLTLQNASVTAGATGELSALGLDGGTLAGGTLVESGGSVALSGTLDAMTWQGGMTLGPQGAVTVVGGISVRTLAGAPGTITLAGGRLAIGDSETLDAMTVAASASASERDYIENASAQDGTPAGTVTFGSRFVLTETAGLTFLQNFGTGSTTVSKGQMQIAGGTLELAGGSVVNRGTFMIGNGACVNLMSNTTISNTGLIDGSGGGVASLKFHNTTSVFTNLVAGVLTGGTLEADANTTLDINDTSALTTDAANIVLNGPGAMIFFATATGGSNNIGGTLTQISGTLVLLNGAMMSATQPLTVTGLVTLTGSTLEIGTLSVPSGGQITGSGAVIGVGSSIDLAGTITASGGALRIHSAVTGSGALVIGAGASLELGPSDSARIGFAGIGTLTFDVGNQPAGPISGLVAGDTLVLANTPAVSATLGGGKLVLTLGHNGSETLAASGAAGLVAHVTRNSQGGSIVTFSAGPLALASMAFAPPAPEPPVAPSPPILAAMPGPPAWTAALADGNQPTLPAADPVGGSLLAPPDLLAGGLSGLHGAGLALRHGLGLAQGLAFAALFGLLAGAPKPAAAGTVLAAEPLMSIAGNFHVALNNGPPAGQFAVMQWQINPLAANRLDVPVTLPFNRLTGFAPPPPFAFTQAGVADRFGATAAQISGKTIGIYLNSLDFSPTGTPQNHVGIFPMYTFPAAPLVLPFTSAGKTVVFTIQAQVPSVTVTPPPNNPAYDGQAYIALDFTYFDTTHPMSPHITFLVHTFSYGSNDPTPESVGADPASKTLLIFTNLGGGQFATAIPASSLQQGQPWIGFRSFETGTTAANLSAAIVALQNSPQLLASLGVTAADFSNNPADYALYQVHVNAELNYAGSPTGQYTGGSVQMGLAVRNMQVSLQDSSDCNKTHNGVDNTLGLEDGNQHFLCAMTRWYMCGGTNARSWATQAATGQSVEAFTCNGSNWVANP